MKLVAPALLLCVVSSGCASTDNGAKAVRTLSYSCGDSVVVGRVHTNSFEPIDVPGDILGHGRFSATIDVERSVRGPTLRGVIASQYFAHAEMRGNLELMLDLKPNGEGIYTIVSRRRLSDHPKVPHRCDNGG